MGKFTRAAAMGLRYAAVFAVMVPCLAIHYAVSVVAYIVFAPVMAAKRTATLVKEGFGK